MLDVIGFDNPIIWVQLRLRRGWKNILAMTAAIGMVIALLVGVSLYLSRRHGSQTELLSLWVGILLGLQLFTFIIGGIASVHGSVRKDVTSGIIESHRLMRVSSWRAVIGYCLGSMLMVMPVAVMTFLFGVALVSDSFWSPKGWVLSNLILVTFSPVVWLAILVLGLYGRVAGWIPFVLLCACAVGSPVVLSMLPGVLILFSPIIDWSIYGVLDNPAQFDERYLLCMLVQGFLAILLFVAAVRKYRRDDVRSFGPLLGVLLVSWWITASALGIMNCGDLRPEWIPFERFDVPARIISAFLVASVLAVVPIASSCYQHVSWHQRRQLRDPGLGRRPMLPEVVVAIVLVIMLSLIVPLSDEVASRIRDELDVTASKTALVLGAFLLGVSYVIRMLYERQRPALLTIILWAFALCTGPFVLDGIRAGIVGIEHEDELISAISGFSPIGQLMFTWDDWDVAAAPGLVGQCLVTVGLAVMYYITRRPGGDTPPAVPGVPSSSAP